MKKIIALITASGKGTRFGGKIAKQYLPFADSNILHHNILHFYNNHKISHILCSIHSDDLDLYQKSISNLNILPPIFGGKERQDSVRNLLEEVKNLKPDYVLIHDAVRPLINQNLINNLINELENNKAVIPVIPIKDTIKKIFNNKIDQTISRDNLYLAQTPQAFHFNEIYELHQKYSNIKLTDDSSLFEQDKREVKVIEGLEANIKITTYQDYEFIYQK